MRESTIKISENIYNSEIKEKVFCSVIPGGTYNFLISLIFSFKNK